MLNKSTTWGENTLKHLKGKHFSGNSFNTIHWRVPSLHCCSYNFNVCVRNKSGITCITLSVEICGVNQSEKLVRVVSENAYWIKYIRLSSGSTLKLRWIFNANWKYLLSVKLHSAKQNWVLFHTRLSSVANQSFFLIHQSLWTYVESSNCISEKLIYCLEFISSKGKKEEAKNLI